MCVLREDEIVLPLNLLHGAGQTGLLGGLLSVLFVFLHENLHQRLEVLIQPSLVVRLEDGHIVNFDQ